MRESIERFVQRAARLAGVEMHRSLGLKPTMAEALEHVVSVGFEPATIVDVGVAHGTQELYDAFPRATLLLVEPLIEFESVLQGVARLRTADYVLAAAGESDGVATIHVHPELFTSSLLPERGGDYPGTTLRRVPMARLDRVCRERGLLGPFLIKADVQGSELSVIDGSTGILDETELIILEVSLFRFYEGNPDFAGIVGSMKERGFVVYDIFAGSRRPIDGALAQVDVMLVKEGGRFRTSHLYVSREDRQRLLRRLRKRHSR